MIKFACDDCKAPIEPSQDHICIQQSILIKDGKMMRPDPLHFDKKECMNSFFTKLLNRSNLITSSQ